MDNKSKARYSFASQNPEQRKVPYPPYYKIVIESDKTQSSMDFTANAILRVLGPDEGKMSLLRDEIQQNQRVEYGSFTKEIAETKVKELLDLSYDNHQKMECFMDPIEPVNNL